MVDRAKPLIDAFASLSLLEGVSLSPDASQVVFGMDANGYRQIYAAPTAHSAWPRRITATLTDCSSPQWSPDGKQLVYVSNTALVIANSDGTQARVLDDHPAGNTEPRWSPDGSRIAFLSPRRGWEQLWTIPIGGGRATQVMSGEYDGDDPVWSPDSRSLVYCSIRENDLMTRGVYKVPAEGGAETLISPHGCWSGAPHFSPDGRLLAYLSDRDGWFHIYLHDLETGSTRQLTNGEYEDGGPYFYTVDRSGGPVFSPDGTMIAWVRHREGNFDVWATGVIEGVARRISKGEGHNRILGWMPDAKQIAVIHDQISRPPDIHLLGLDGETVRLTHSGTAELESNAMIKPEWISFQARDGLEIHAGLLTPCPTEETPRERFPAVVFLHGGPNFQFADYYYPLPELLAQAGFVVLAPNFRGSTGYGTAFRHANFREWGHADAMDAIDAAIWLGQRSFVDPERIAVMGPSYGGYLTLAALTMAPDLFCAGVDLYGDSEIGESFRHGDRYGRIDLERQMGTPEDNPEGYRRGSPFYRAGRIRAPLLILHGKKDRLVVPLMSEKMIEALRIEDKYFESHFYDEEEHGFDRPETKKDAWNRILRFLNRFCKGQGQPD